MSSSFSRIELDLKTKLTQRVSVRQSAEQYLFKSFKFFDVSDSGFINFTQWSRALEKIGLSPSGAELEQWFNHFDQDRDGKINYKTVCNSLFAPSTTQLKEKLTPTTRNTGLSVIDLVKKKLVERGEDAVVALDRHLFVNFTTGRLTKTSFASAIRDACPELELRNADIIYELASGPAGATYTEFADLLWGNPSQERVDAIQRAFSRLDDDGDGFINLRSIRRSYAAKQHPSVKAGAKTSDDVYRVFLSSFESHHRYKGLPSEQVSRQEWGDYYRLISAITVSDSFFEGMLRGVWSLNEPSTPGSVEVEVDLYGDLPGKPGAKRGRTSNTLDLHQSSHLQTGVRHRDSTSPSRQVDQVLNNFRQKLAKRGVKGIIGLSKQLSLLDMHSSGLISLRDLMTVLRNYRVDFNDSEINAVFQHFDKSGTGSIPYKRLLNAIIGRISTPRQQAIEEAWELVSQGQSSVDIKRLGTAYVARRHPDVKSGIKTESEVHSDFIESLTLFQKLESSNTNLISKADFSSFYELLSSCYEDDHKFDKMVRQVWHLNEGEDAKPKTKDRWSADHRFIFGGSATATAPFGVSNEPTDWSTSLRPRTSQEYAEDRKLPAGSPTKHRPKTAAYGIDDALEELRSSVKVRGYKGFLSFAAHLKKRDSSGSGSIPTDSLKAVLRELRFPLSESAVAKLTTSQYATSRGLQYEILLNDLKGPLNSHRKGVISQTFNKLARHSDSVPLHEFKQKYIAKNHPAVLQGRQTEDAVLAEFLTSVDIHQSLLPRSARPMVTISEFQDFYWYVSASVEDDRAFEQLLRSSWILGWNSTF